MVYTMKNILCLNKIAAIGTDKLDRAVYNVGTDVEAPVGIMVRSAAMHDMEFGPELQAIARAGAGVNNIPVDRCSKEGIVVFNTPGANANGVKELAICALMLASRDVLDRRRRYRRKRYVELCTCERCYGYGNLPELRNEVRRHGKAYFKRNRDSVFQCYLACRSKL